MNEIKLNDWINKNPSLLCLLGMKIVPVGVAVLNPIIWFLEFPYEKRTNLSECKVQLIWYLFALKVLWIPKF